MRDVDSVLTQAHGALREGGHLLISDGAFNFLQGAHSKSVGAGRRFTKGQLLAKLERLNSDVRKVSYWGLSLFFVLLIKRCIMGKILPRNWHVAHFDLVEMPIVDQLLYLLVTSETYIINKLALPFGASIAILARK